jgi:hypothetical protein
MNNVRINLVLLMKAILINSSKNKKETALRSLEKRYVLIKYDLC